MQWDKRSARNFFKACRKDPTTAKALEAKNKIDFVLTGYSSSTHFNHIKRVLLKEPGRSRE